jgi:hypothetical protein
MMDTPTPLIRQGIKPFRGKSTFYFKFFLIFTVHVVAIGGLLLQGCKDTSPKEASAALPPLDPTSTITAVNPVQTLPPLTKTSFSNTVAIQRPPAQQAPKAPLPAAVTDAKEYVVAPGDTLGTIARKNGVALKALIDANPKINPRKLHAGRKLKVPATKAA